MIDRERCASCPVDPSKPCRGTAIPPRCDDPRYRAYFVELAELLDNAESCPHRVPMPDDRRTACGCRHLCTLGKGPRHRKGGVTLSDCWDCPIAPRLGAPPSPDRTPP